MLTRLAQATVAFVAGSLFTAALFVQGVIGPAASQAQRAMPVAAAQAQNQSPNPEQERKPSVRQRDASEAPRQTSQRPQTSAADAIARPAQAQGSPLKPPIAPDAPDQLDLDLSKPIPQDVLDRVVEVAREIDPQLGKRLAQACAERPQELDLAIRQGQLGRKLLAMAQLKQTDIGLYRTKLSEMTYDMQVRKVAADLREAMRSGNSERAAMLETQLRNVLKIQLALSIKARAEYLKRLEQHIEAVRAEIDQQAQDLDETVEARFAKLLAEPSPQAKPDDSSQLIPAGKTTVTPGQ